MTLKPGIRALGVAESFEGETSTLAGVVTTTRGRVDGLALARCTVGGLDVTEAVQELWGLAGRPDVQYLFLNGVALAWYNIVDLETLAERLPIPVIALSYEESHGLAEDIRAHFSDGDARRRIERYRALPARSPVRLDDATVYARAVGFGAHPAAEPAEVIRAFTESGARPEPVRAARLVARAADRWARSE